MNVAKIGAQLRQTRLNIRVGAIPLKHGLDREVMPQVMHARAALVAGLAQAGLAGHQQEPAIDGVIAQPDATVPDKEGRIFPFRINGVADRDVTPEGRDG